MSLRPGNGEAMSAPDEGSSPVARRGSRPAAAACGVGTPPPLPPLQWSGSWTWAPSARYADPIGLREDFDGAALRRLARASQSANQGGRLQTDPPHHAPLARRRLGESQWVQGRIKLDHVEQTVSYIYAIPDTVNFGQSPAVTEVIIDETEALPPGGLPHHYRR